MTYDPAQIEPRWQAFWEQNATFRTDTSAGTSSGTSKPTYYVLDMFPYPSGAGLHVGHVEGYTASDIVARHKRMKGFEVLHPMGWDAFGLPAEQYAISQNVHPRISTQANLDNFRAQLKAIGFSYDWEREVGTFDPEFYRWTQWIFLKLLEHDLAYQSEALVNWCPALGTVLANDEVIDGKSERGGHPVERKPMKQWMLRITKYADRLLDGLDEVEFPESIKAMQRDRIGRSEGADATFAIKGHDAAIEVFTTRPDTMFGATFCVLAPEHDLVKEITTDEQRAAVDEYLAAAAAKSEIARTGNDAGKTGVFTGAFAVNPATGEEVPIWVADYVLMGYGTGAIMCVPGHDERDWMFATKFDLPIIEVVAGGDVTEAAYSGDGPHVNSSSEAKGIDLNGLGKEAAITKMCEWLEANGLGKKIVRYRMRDWIFARQRYWGEPIPVVIAEDGEVHPLPFDELPLNLPDTADYTPSETGEAPLSRIKDWMKTTVPGQPGKPAQREADTMPGSAGSSWYFFRFIDPRNQDALCDPEKAKAWLPVDLYVGGAEHAVGHLLYSRFWTKFLFDIGVSPVEEPFKRLVNQGMILGEDSRKMGKRYGNTVDPFDVIKEYGADTLRMFEMFLGPIEQEKPWSQSGLDGVRRFLNRAWRLYCDDSGEPHSTIADEPMDDDIARLLHQTIAKVEEDTEGLRFNTAIAQMMIFVNEMLKKDARPREAMESFCLLLAPYAPHFAEEIWQKLGHEESITYATFPVADASKLVEDSIEVPVQINGKVRARLQVAADIDEAAIKELALADEAVDGWISGKELKVFKYIPGRLVTIAIKG
ncbi:Leucine--tRNA ligase [Planctomycetes bacterium Poly30]|uniref:Leucine--tRNA ligase n=1 Tax=Saltatorellus ferox TaxID=2528018 RepID=A0A518EYR1_9BACT|nr:Leucine--tRNA ligase [Planctomycetes bacterium Poly30]